MQETRNDETGRKSADVITLNSRRRAQARRTDAVRKASRKKLEIDPASAAVHSAAFELKASEVRELGARVAASGIPLPATFGARLQAVMHELETLGAEIELASFDGEVA